MQDMIFLALLYFAIGAVGLTMLRPDGSRRF